MSTSTRLAVAIGLAMVLHKGPVAFGLSAYLIAQQAAHSEVLKVWRSPAVSLLLQLKL